MWRRPCSTGVWTGDYWASYSERQPANTRNNILIEVDVCEEEDPQFYLGRAFSRARFSFLDRLSGSGVCLAAHS